MTNFDDIKSYSPEKLASLLYAIYMLGWYDHEAGTEDFLWDRQWLEKEIGE